MAGKPVGRPPAEPTLLPQTLVDELMTAARAFSKDKGKLKAWLAPKRIFHVLLQDHIATLPIPGGKGIVQNAASSKLFLEMTEPLADALKDVTSDDDEGDDIANEQKPRRVGVAAQRKGRRIGRVPR